MSFLPLTISILVLLDGKGPIANKEGIAYYNRLIDALLENGTSLSSPLPNIWFKCLKVLGFKDGLVLNLMHGLWIGIQPYVTLFHFDLPQAFQDSFGGWRSPLIV